MSRNRLKKKIINASKRVGIDKIGFMKATNFFYLKDSLTRQKNKGYNSGFEHQNIDERLDPKIIFDNPKTIISIALAYPSHFSSKLDNSNEKRGEFARASWGIDYHKILHEKINLLISEIKSLTTGELRFKAMVDTGELIDVVIAAFAGVGFIGKNGLLITKEFGSFVYLGEIISNLEIIPDNPRKNKCGNCRRCLDNCPSKALLGGGRMNAKRCLSYQTQTKGFMPIEFRKLMRKMIYGCDVCQLVCPFNRGKNFFLHREMEPKINEVRPILKDFLTMSNFEFKKRFGKMAGSWRGKKPLLRNAIIALANINDRSAVNDFTQIIKTNPVAMIRGTAAWGVGQLVKRPTEDLKKMFEFSLKKETDEETIQEFERVLKKWETESA